MTFHRWIVASLLAAILATGCAVPQPATPTPQAAPVPAGVRQTLAPTGTLRIAAYAGSPTSLVHRLGGDELSGLSVDIGRELALRLDVPAQIVEFDRVELVLDALRNNQADLTITNATAARAALVDFTEPLVAIELGYLVLADSPVQAIADVDRAGVRVGVSQGSSSQATLGSTYRFASLVPAPSLKVAAAMLRDHRIDAFATNKGILFQMSDELAGSRVLDGRWGVESLAIAIPKGRDVARPWLSQFAAAATGQGLVRRAAKRAGLRGLAEPQAR